MTVKQGQRLTVSLATTGILPTVTVLTDPFQSTSHANSLNPRNMQFLFPFMAAERGTEKLRSLLKVTVIKGQSWDAKKGSRIPQSKLLSQGLGFLPSRVLNPQSCPELRQDSLQGMQDNFPRFLPIRND